MAPRRSQAKERQFMRRGRGVMKKGDDVNLLIPDVKVAVFFLDGTNLWSYQSEDGWVSSLPSIANIREERLDPTHFRTVFQQRQALEQGDQSTSASPVLAPTSEPSLFLSPEPQDRSSPSTLATNNTTGPPAHPHTPVSRPGAKSSPVVLLRRKTRAGVGAVLPRRTRNAVRENQKSKDVYGFIDMDD